MNKILLIDNYDSFTYNLLHLIQQQYTGKVEVLRDYQIPLDQLDMYSAIIISPGPGRPETTPIVMNILGIVPVTIPILGICLGMQCINEFFGGSTVKGVIPVHGKVSKLRHNDPRGIYKYIPQDIDIARYHSLVISPASSLSITGYSEDNTIMSISHITRPIYGIQFHPESFLSQYGDRIIKNFLEVTALL